MGTCRKSGNVDAHAYGQVSMACPTALQYLQDGHSLIRCPGLPQLKQHPTVVASDTTESASLWEAEYFQVLARSTWRMSLYYAMSFIAGPARLIHLPLLVPCGEEPTYLSNALPYCPKCVDSSPCWSHMIRVEAAPPRDGIPQIRAGSACRVSLSACHRSPMYAMHVSKDV